MWFGMALQLSRGSREGDVIDYIWDTDNGKAILIVTRNSVVGTFSKLTSKATIDDVEYSFVSGAVKTKLLGETVKALLNKDGKIVFMDETTDSPSALTYAVVIAKSDAEDEFQNPIRKLKVVNSDGSSATLDVVSSQASKYDGDSSSATVVGVGDVIQYGTNDSGAINSLTIVLKYNSAAYGDKTVDDKLSLIEGDRITNNTIVFDISGVKAKLDASKVPSASDVKIVPVSILLDAGTINAAVKEGQGRALVVASIEQLVAADSTKLGMYYGSYRTSIGGTRYWVLRILTDGIVTDYVVDRDLLDPDYELNHEDNFGASISISKKMLTFDANADDEITDNLEVVNPTYVSDSVYEWRVVDVDLENGVIAVQKFDKSGEPASGVAYYWVDEDTLYYDVSGTPISLTLEDVALWSKVRLYMAETGTPPTPTSQVLVLVVEAD